jgi:hypothetical protein
VRDARQEQDMPETAKTDGRDEKPGAAQDAEAGLKKETGLSPEALAAEAKTGPAVEAVAEEPAGAALDFPEDGDIHEFARSVLSSLEEARGRFHGVDDAGPDAGSSSLDAEASFFAGWQSILDDDFLDGANGKTPGKAPLADEDAALEADQPLAGETPLDDEPLIDDGGLLDDRRLDDDERLLDDEPSLDEEFGEAAAQSFDQHFEGPRSLAEMGLAARAMAEEDGEDYSIKHDELADAVHLALSSLYGETSTPPPSPVADASAFTARSTGWTPPGVVGSADEALSPQEVILNYFNYDTPAKNGAAAEAYDRSPVFDGEGGRDGVGNDAYYSDQPQWGRQSAEPGLYDGPPSYPVPAGFVPPAKEAAAERENSRLLGAAAIGLIGGIAIAASLAVFVINSYGPGMKAGVAANRAADPSELGYGRRRGETPDTQKDATAPAEQPAGLAASDIVATPGQPSALAIAVRPEGSNDQALVSITGMPDGARLSAGVDAGGGNWLLPPHRLRGLAINVPSATEPFNLEVQLIDSNVRTPLSDKKQFAVRLAGAKPETASLLAVPLAAAPPEAPFKRELAQPASAVEAPAFSTQTVSSPGADTTAPARPEPESAEPAFRAAPAPAAPAPAPRFASAPVSPQRGGPQADIEDLIREGNKRMREGDILEARQFYQKAVALGDPEAALAMGRSFDPIYFARIDKKNAEPDAAKAFDWYRKAMDGGAVQTAKVRIENLKHFLNE